MSRYYPEDDHVLEKNNKADYFPHSHYRIINDGKIIESSALKADTIMKIGDRLFIFDENTTSTELFLIRNSCCQLHRFTSKLPMVTMYLRTGLLMRIRYNAFIIPFSAEQGEDVLRFVSAGTGDWKVLHEHISMATYWDGTIEGLTD